MFRLVSIDYNLFFRKGTIQVLTTRIKYIFIKLLNDLIILTLDDNVYKVKTETGYKINVKNIFLEKCRTWKYFLEISSLA